MGSKLVIILSGVLGMFFLYAGVCKLYPNLDQDLHLSMKKHFVNYARVAPLRTALNVRFRAGQYRSAFGSLEVVGGFGLLCMTGSSARSVAFVMLIIAELFMIHSYMMLGDPLQKYVRLVAAAVLLVVQMCFERWFSEATQNKKETSSQKEEHKVTQGREPRKSEGKKER